MCRPLSGLIQGKQPGRLVAGPAGLPFRGNVAGSFYWNLSMWIVVGSLVMLSITEP